LFVIAAFAVVGAAPAAAYDWIDSGAVAAGSWGLNGPNDKFNKINGFYFGGGTFKLCVRKSSPAYADIKDCGWVYDPQPQARILACGTTLFGKPGLWNGDNSGHTFEIRSYYSC
jgi:hypothetical protein